MKRFLLLDAVVLFPILSFSAQANSACVMERFNLYSGNVVQSYIDNDSSDCHRAEIYCQEDLERSQSSSPVQTERCINAKEDIYSGRASYSLWNRGANVGTFSATRFDTSPAMAHGYADSDASYKCFLERKKRAEASGDPLKYENESECREN
jgi:hypothetical protein